MNDLAPESQPWVREVESSNLNNSRAIDSLAQNSRAQQATTRAALATVEARIGEYKQRSVALGKFTSLYRQAEIGTMSPAVGQWVTLASDIALSPTGETMSPRFFALATLTYNLSVFTGTSRFRVVVNESASSGTAAFGTGGTNLVQATHAGSVAPTNRIDLLLQFKANTTDFSNATTSDYANRVRYSLAVVWS